MKQRTRKIAISLLIVLAVIVSMVPASAFGVTQADIDAMKAQRDEITKKREAQQVIVDGLAEQQATVLEKKKALDDRNAYTIEQIKLTDEAIAMYSELIAQKAVEVDAARERENAQLQRLRTRIRAMEENGTLNYIALILKANNLGELLTAIDDIAEIMASDKALERQYIAAREETERIKAEYEAYKAEQEANMAELEAEKAQLEAELEEANELIRQITENLEAEQGTLQEIEDAFNAADEKVNKLIEELEAQRAAEEEARRKAEEEARQQSQGGGGGGGNSGGTVTGSGSFIWPVSCTYITSCVGYRYHPITGVWKYHAGMDIGCAYGDAVWASDGGTVMLGSDPSGYGNYITINHGNGYYTRYAHLSSFAVSDQQVVSQGQVIGYVGSTGASTGPHLHFEIRDASGALDFQSWFSGLSYAPDSGGG